MSLLGVITDEEKQVVRELRARIYRAEVINDDVPAEMQWDCRKFITDIDFQIDGKSVPPTFANPFRRLPTISDMPFLWAPDFKWSDEAVEFDPLITEDDMEDEDVAQRITIAPIIFDEERSLRIWLLRKPGRKARRCIYHQQHPPDHRRALGRCKIHG